ncbi:ImmA/IrrE family metallo-endopeptidase [Micromonospora rifamycinica]|nr:ImmA/IrrE family metallo-endopeptidase [Micromonospora rifamycinica]
MVERYDLVPPVNIKALLRDCADLYFEGWPFTGCDALVHGLHLPRPQVFVRNGLPPRRERLTLAHEYGHIKMGWHYGTVGCQAVPSEVAIEAAEGIPGPTHDADDQEREATRFASYLLIPDRHLVPLINNADMGLILDGLDRTGVSADAAFMRLRDLLQPGFLFTFEVKSDRRFYTSPGTVMPTSSSRLRISSLREASADSGTAYVGGRRVDWFRLTDFAAFEPAPGSQSATELLRSAINSHENDPEFQQKLLLSINGVVGGSLSAERARHPEQALALLRHKFDSKPEFQEIVNDPSFDLYLRRKVEEWAVKRGIL